MELERHADGLREQLTLAAEAGGEESRALAQRLTAQLDSAVRLMLLEVLTAAAAEITRELAPGSVELRLRGRDPEFVVVARSAPDSAGEGSGTSEAWTSSAPLSGSAGSGEGGVSRVNLRLPGQLKSRVEQAAGRQGVSINTWLVRAAAAAAQRGETGVRRAHNAPRGGQRYTGWGN
jgi:HicB family